MRRRALRPAAAAPQLQQQRQHLLQLLLLALALAAASLAPTGGRAAFPPQPALQVPARLVFTQLDLAQCLAAGAAAGTATCVLRGPLKLDEAAWRQLHAATGGTAFLPSAAAVTLTTQPCTAAGLCLNASPSARGGPPPTLDLSRAPAVLLLAPRAVLRLEHMAIAGLATREAYFYSAAQPYAAVGVGTGASGARGRGPAAAPRLLRPAHARPRCARPATQACGRRWALRRRRSSP